MKQLRASRFFSSQVKNKTKKALILKGNHKPQGPPKNIVLSL